MKRAFNLRSSKLMSRLRGAAAAVMMTGGALTGAQAQPLPNPQALTEYIQNNPSKGWGDNVDRSAIAPVMRAAMDMLYSINMPVYAQFFGSTVLEIKPGGANGPNVPMASFTLANNGMPSVTIYDQTSVVRRAYDSWRAGEERMGTPNLPGFQQAQTFLMALSISNEASHFLSYLRDTGIIRASECSAANRHDERLSDIRMLDTATTLYMRGLDHPDRAKGEAIMHATAFAMRIYEGQAGMNMDFHNYMMNYLNRDGSAERLANRYLDRRAGHYFGHCPPTR